MDINQRERVIDLQNMSEEQLQMLIQNLNKELENAKQEFQNKLKRILMPFISSIGVSSSKSSARLHVPADTT